MRNEVLIKKGLFESICEEKKDLETVLESIHRISSTLDPNEVLYFVVSKIAEIIDVTRCSIVSIPFEEKKTCLLENFIMSDTFISVLTRKSAGHRGINST